jgi:hypothetical protein
MAGDNPRAHHFVPQFWLAGFTENGERDGKLWVTDLERNKQWESSPANTGHRRDFYRIEHDLDPTVIEKAFSKIESQFAPLFRMLVHERRGPFASELKPLLWFVALQFGRTPVFRPLVLRILNNAHRERFAVALASRVSWDVLLKEVGTSSDEPGADYEGMKMFFDAGNYTLSAATEWYVEQTFKAVETIFPLLRQRYWRTVLSVNGNFIASDNPVVLESETPRDMIGFKNADAVLYAVSRHVLLLGTRKRQPPELVNHWRIAGFNTITMLHADSQFFSHRPDFIWLAGERDLRTDWTQFSKSKLIEAMESSPPQTQP